eukprot:NODE_3_length_6198_cov_35.846642_g2_i0.p1 GENE.NODE_3_length_6198_cov_35.846642_g2_i0~~NODE_3_length_6198_cov_35.846642_g2_i0.p1  ORF type:complete len:589 (+),score=184.60 NODE_3_length_6198_cov_35.846642_g2_i0:2670-4436(+)
MTDTTAIRNSPTNPLAGPPMVSTEDERPDFEAKMEDHCPFAPLGFSGQHYHLLNISGELVSLNANQLEKASTQAALVHGDITWFKEAYPPQDQRQQFDAASSRNWIMMACHAKGYFDPTQHKLRKTGVWKVGSGSASRLLAHTGNSIYFEGTTHAPGFQKEGAYYLISAPIPKMADRKQAASVEDCRAIYDVVRTWTFKDPDTGPDLWFGWLMAALYGGAPDWRVHMMVAAERGSGKSWLVRLVDELLGGLAQFANDATEAGIRQAAEGRSGAILYDEAEGDPAGGVKRVIELIRRMSGGAGAVTLRGSAGGKSTTFVVAGVAYVTAILPPVLEPQDKSRFVQVDLGPLTKGKDGMANEIAVEKIFARTAELSPKLRRRSFDNWERFRLSLEAYRDAFAALDVGPRDSLRFATVLAGRDIGLHDELLEGDYYEFDAARFLPLIEQTLSDGEDGEGSACLKQILSTPLKKLRVDNSCNIGEQIAFALGNDEGANKILGRLGLKALPKWKDENGDGALLVANAHPMLEDIYNGSKWPGQQWVQALRYLDGASALGKPVRFAGVLQKCTRVPARYLPEPFFADQGNQSVTP